MSREHSPPRSIGPLRWTGALLALLASVLVLVAAGYTPPAPRGGGGAGDAGFSALEAQRVLSEVVAPHAPHPAGSESNARLRERLEARLRRIGYQPDRVEGFTCSGYGACGRVANVRAVLSGAERGPGLLLVANYDSMMGSPGASDSGVGAAVLLEVARLLRQGGQLRRDVHFLFTDGENLGALGANVFARRSESRQEVGAVLSFEGGGLSGPSVLASAGPSSAWLVSQAANALRRPVSNSAIAAVIDVHTDLTELEALGTPGAMFAYGRDGRLILSERDTLDRVDLRTLQHHGDNALQMARRLADQDLSSPPPGEGVWFDLLGTLLIWWPSKLTVPLACLAAALNAAAAAIALRRRTIEARPLAAAAAVSLLVVVSCIGLGVLLTEVLGLSGARRTANVAYPEPPLLGALTVPLAAAAALGGAFRGIGAPSFYLGVWNLLAAASLALSAAAPAFGYLLVVPALVAGTAATALYARPERSEGWRLVAYAVPAWVLALLFVSLLWLAKDAFGLQGFTIYVAAMGVVFAACLPLVAEAARFWRWRLPVAASVTSGLTLSLLALLPGASPSRPEPLSIVAHRHAEGAELRDQWFAAGRPAVPIRRADLPPGLLENASFGHELISPFPWVHPHYLAAPAPAFDMPVVGMNLLEDDVVDGNRRVRIHIVSSRGAERVALLASPGVPILHASANGVPVPTPGKDMLEALRGWRLFRFISTPSDANALELIVRGEARIDAYLLDQSASLPRQARALIKARTPSQMSMHDGDCSFTTRKVHF